MTGTAGRPALGHRDPLPRTLNLRHPSRTDPDAPLPEINRWS